MKNNECFQLLRHGVSLKILADDLGERVDLHYMEKCVYDFIANMLFQVGTDADSLLEKK